MFGRIKTYNKWVFLELDHELGRFYRSLFKLEWGIKLQRPSNGEHATIISQYDFFDCSTLRSWDGIKFEFELDNDIYTNQNAFWINVFSPCLLDWRDSLGLDKPERDLHFCFGYQKENDSRRERDM